jgi:hypothetical protein
MVLQHELEILVMGLLIGGPHLTLSRAAFDPLAGRMRPAGLVFEVPGLGHKTI